MVAGCYLCDIGYYTMQLYNYTIYQTDPAERIPYDGSPEIRESNVD